MTENWDVVPIAGGELSELTDVDNAAFHVDPPSDYLTDVALPMLEVPRLTGVRDPDTGDRLVGTAAILSKSMTFPGGRVHPVAAATWVAVRAGWRRRGILSALMRDQLTALHDDGREAVAILTASEGVIYGRYGYARAVDRAEIRLPHGVPFAPEVAVEAVREADADTAATQARSLWARVAPTLPGHLSRPDPVWHARFADHEFMRRGSSRRRWAAHPDGLVGYRVRPSWHDRDDQWVVTVTELIAATPIAHASLWRFLLDLDLTARVEYQLGWIDDPVQDLLADRRSLTLTPQDHVWLRIVDLDRAVALRSYPTTASVDVEVADPGCPWNAGRWHLDLTPDGGWASRTTAAPQVRLDVRALAGCLVGATPLARLVAGGLVAGDPAALARLGSALSTPVSPWCPEGF